MRLPPGEPVTRNGLPSLSTMVGVIDDSGRLPGPGALASPPTQAEGVRRAGLGGEIVELVVEQDAGALGDQAEAVAEIERVGVGDGVAEAVDHGEMRGVAALARRRQRRADLRRRPRAVGIDARAQLRGIVLRGQPRDRHVHDVAGSPRKCGAVGIGELHRLDHQVQRGGRRRRRRSRKPSRMLSISIRMHAAGRGRRHRYDVVAAIACRAPARARSAW